MFRTSMSDTLKLQGMETALDDSTEATDGHDWREAGEAWGHSAADWACLYEHYAIDVLIAIFDRLRVTSGMQLLDIACGSGFALRRAEAMGAETAGIDAASSLLDLAAARNPNADLRLGSMFELPWDDESFDAAISINGIWGGCEAALVEAYRVLRPGGAIGISFWGTGAPNDMRGCFKAFARHAPQQHFTSMKRLNDIAAPGVAEGMLVDSGFDVVERGARVSTIEWPDADIAWRALASVGPAVPALRHTDPEIVRRAVLDAIDHCRDHSGVYRFQSDHHFVIARKPGPD
jgi:SAM-dependent methyltransferase